MRREPKPRVVTCPRCGQRGNELPGLKLGEYEHLEATWAVARGSIEVRKP